MIKNFLEQLRIQRWDDHRYYHHSRINQSLHFVSAISFMVGYVMMFFDPLMSALIGWLVSMTSRQAGHFFFEPRGYDHINQATHEHKEEIKVGYNLRRKVVLMTIWAASPLVLYADPTLFGLFTPWATPADFMRQVAKIWLVVGIGGLLFRTVHLFFIYNVETGLVWMTKILTDPFNDFMLYRKRAAGAAARRADRSGPRHPRARRAWKKRTPERSLLECLQLVVMAGLVPGICVFGTVIASEAKHPSPESDCFVVRPRTDGNERSECGERQSPPERAGEHLFQDLAADALVGEGAVMPPPAVLLHLRRRRDEAASRPRRNRHRYSSG